MKRLNDYFLSLPKDQQTKEVEELLIDMLDEAEADYDAAREEGYDNGHGDGRSEGYDEGFEQGHAEGFEEGLEEGRSETSEG